MHALLVTLHATGGAIVIGTLFLQSLAAVMALRLPTVEQRNGVRTLQRNVHRLVYYPILAVTLLSGLITATLTHAFSQGRWLHWKLVLVVLLIGLGMLVGHALNTKRVVKPVAMVIHILIFFISGGILYLAVLKPF